jgi:hypothetical protein
LLIEARLQQLTSFAAQYHEFAISSDLALSATSINVLVFELLLRQFSSLAHMSKENPSCEFSSCIEFGSPWLPYAEWIENLGSIAGFSSHGSEQNAFLCEADMIVNEIVSLLLRYALWQSEPNPSFAGDTLYKSTIA